MEGFKTDVIKLVLMYFAVTMVLVYASGCTSSAGGKFFCGFEEVNGITETKTYRTNDIKK